MARRARLYAALGVGQDATPQEIKRAYYQQAQRYHPDRGGTADAERFKQVQSAYEVLGDPDRKALYDRFGEAALRAAGGNEAAFMALAAGPDPAAVVASVFTLALAFLMMVSLRVDGVIAWPWTVTLFPLWLVDAVLLVPVVALPCLACQGERVAAPLAAAVQCAAAVCFTFALVAKLDGYTARPWVEVFAPLYVGAAAAVPACAAACSRPAYEELCALLGEPPDTPSLPYSRYLTGKALALVRNVALPPLLALRLDGAYAMSFAVATSPLLAQTAVHAALSLWDAFKAHARGEGGLAPALCNFLCTYGVGWSQYLLLVAKCDGADMPLWLALVPAWVAVGVPTCAACCLWQYGVAVGDDGDDEAGDEEAPAEPQERDPLLPRRRAAAAATQDVSEID
eukprot:TRINITY_DN12339_c0_g1_i1.p1 TRINITY_DN12339_c0_g1~~TRINITY_DN12339_c0_g1_i1.p1  ORF type:complete len:398 (+),score=129.29 TRINITY_DN12339_c0_g1_i1:94-1287(+)